MLSGQNSAEKLITRALIHCVLQTSDITGYPEASQSERAKMDIYWFGIY